VFIFIKPDSVTPKIILWEIFLQIVDKKHFFKRGRSLEKNGTEFENLPRLLRTKENIYETVMKSGIAGEFQRYKKFNDILPHFKKKVELK